MGTSDALKSNCPGRWSAKNVTEAASTKPVGRQSTWLGKPRCRLCVEGDSLTTAPYVDDGINDHDDIRYHGGVSATWHLLGKKLSISVANPDRLASSETEFG